jgi:hypothetical protein
MSNKLYTDSKYERYKKYKKKYSKGSNFDLDLKEIPVAGKENDPGAAVKDKVDWDRVRKEFKLSKKQIMILIDTGVIDHTWQDTTHDDKMYKGTVSFKNREPLKEK